MNDPRKYPVLTVLFLLFVCTSALAQNNLKLQYIEKAQNYLVKDSSVYSWFEISDQGVKTFKPDAEGNPDSVRFYIPFERIGEFEALAWSFTTDSLCKMLGSEGNFPTLSPENVLLAPTLPEVPSGISLPLSGLRIAIDPGHVGGSMEFAEMEEKYVKIHAGVHPRISHDIQFNEGNLTVTTGHFLKKMLENGGADVLITRDSIGLTAFGISFEEWKKSQMKHDLPRFANDQDMSMEEAEKWLDNADDKAIFHSFFKYSEFRERAGKINSFRPHLTVFLHYNIEANNEPEEGGWFVPVEHNYSMTFTPGSFMKNELDDADEQIEFLRLLLLEDISQSVEFSGAVQHQFQEYLEVPVVAYDSSHSYLWNASLQTGIPGVFPRNLSMTRMVKGIQCFGEPLLQDNVKEALQLSSSSMEVNGMPTSKRCKETARAYFFGILDYLEEVRMKNKY